MTAQNDINAAVAQISASITDIGTQITSLGTDVSAIQAEIATQGFRDDDGTLWTPGNLVWVESDFLGLTQVMLIKSARFVQSRDEGSMTYIGLVDPQAFGGKVGKGGSAKDPKRICGWCGVREQCLAYALDLESRPGTMGRFGVYGGTSPKERDRIAGA